MISASIKRNVPIVSKLEVRKGEGPLSFPVGQKPPRKRASAANWPKELESLKAPGLRFVTKGSPEDQKPVTPVDEDGATLRATFQNGEVIYSRGLTTTGEDGKSHTEWATVDIGDVLFVDSNGDQYTIEGVQEMNDFDYLTMTGTTEDLTKLYSAIQRFSKATGKGIIVRHESETTDERGNTLTQTKLIVRTR